MRKHIVPLLSVLLFMCVASAALGAYHHEGEQDSSRFLAVYPEKAGGKLDHCALCHTGGQYEGSGGQMVSMGSCQWCHRSYGYDGSGNIVDTLNPYGLAYLVNGRNEQAVRSIDTEDSDGDGYTNAQEISANRYPGHATDNPETIPAPYRVYTKAQLEAMPQHTQFLLMNTNRSGDFYGEYSGVILEDLLADAGISGDASGITVYAPDGFSTYHPLQPVDDPNLYHINGVYPEAAYQYDQQADQAINSVDGWCDYSAPSCAGRSHMDPIQVAGGLRAILAVKREGAYLTHGLLNQDNKLDGEGPFRVVVPQKVASAPDQSSRATNQAVLWPYVNSWDHNAGFCSRTATIIRVEPLPPGTTDIDILEAGWNFVDQEKIIVYGAIAQEPSASMDPQGTIRVNCLRHEGARYQAIMRLYSNPADPGSLCWRLDSVASSTDETMAESVMLDSGFNLQIPCLRFMGLELNVDLGLFSNPADPDHLYWRLNGYAAR